MIDDASTTAHKTLARKVAEQGTVLLKNSRNTLPLKAKKSLSVALIGPTASSTLTDGVSAASMCSMAWRFSGGGTMNCEDLVSPETAIRQLVESVGGTVTFNPGTDPAAAAQDAAKADVSIVFGYQKMGEFSDLTDLKLQGGGDALIEAVSATAKKTVVVLQTGTAVEMPWLKQVDAVLETWYAGEQMGPALSNILFGDVNPSGKLPMTFPKSLADTPMQSDEQYPGIFSDGSTTRPAGTSEIRQVNYTEELKVGYRWYASQQIDPLFEFGHGLSYTDFRYSNLQVTPLINSRGSRDLRIRVRLTNTGRVTGTETAQAYVTLPSAAKQPSKRLLTWDRVTLRPGESRTVEMTLSAKELAEQRSLQYWNTGSESWQTAKGIYRVSVGGSFDTSVTDLTLVWGW